MLLDCLKHTLEVHSTKPPDCTSRRYAERKRSDESDRSDMECTKAGLKLTRLSESESLSDTDYGVDEDNSKPKKMKYQ